MDRNYTTASKREASKGELGYRSAASGVAGVPRLTTGEGIGGTEQGQLPQEIQEIPEMEQDLNELGTGESQFGMDGVRVIGEDYMRATSNMMLEAVKEMCKQLGDVFSKLHEEQIGWLFKITQSNTKREKAIEEMIAACSRGIAHHAAGYKEPMLFSGANAREWLMQMRQYYDSRSFLEATRLRDAPFYLRGEAHMYYYTIVQHYPERLPKTWEEFEKLIIQRFCSKTTVEIMHKLMRIKYRNSVSEVTEQFARACAEGDPLPREKLIYLFLSRFPKDMVEEALKKDFSTWVEASEYLSRQNRKVTERLAEWYQLAPPKFKRKVEADKQCFREGWIIKNQQKLGLQQPSDVRQKPTGRANGTNRLVSEATRGLSN